VAVRSVSLEGSGPVRRIRLHRPPVNALDARTLEELGAAADALGADMECRVVVIASAIDGVFCSGGDLKFWRTFPREQARDVGLVGRESFARIARIRKPTIAAIDGHLIGDGIALALSCDLRLASPRASFRLPEVEYGFIPGWGTLHHLVRTIGHPRTLDMILTGCTVGGRTALEWGLVSRIQPTGTFDKGLEMLVHGLLVKSPTALSLAKAALQEGVEGPDATPE
jgi:enoyl-CoA hydratase/carnithine racemase